MRVYVVAVQKMNPETFDTCKAKMLANWPGIKEDFWRFLWDLYQHEDDVFFELLVDAVCGMEKVGHHPTFGHFNAAHRIIAALMQKEADERARIARDEQAHAPPPEPMPSRESVGCPVCGLRGQDLVAAMAHLRETHGWTFRDVARWLEQLDARPYIDAALRATGEAKERLEP